MNVRDVRPRDAIRSLDEPRFEPEHAGAPSDEVVVVDAEPPRAYPVRILHHHQVVNDDLDRLGPVVDAVDERWTTVGGGMRTGADGSTRTGTDGATSTGSGGTTAVPEPGPIAVTWCPICWSAAVYDRRIGGDVVTFGVTGNLADDALVLYDRQTGTEWRQTGGDAISGPLEGTRLGALPCSIQTAAQFREAHPDGLVLQPDRGRDDAAESVGPDDAATEIDPAAALAEVYDPAECEAYAERDAFGRHGLRGEGEPRTWERTDLDAKALVLGIETETRAVGYPEPVVREAGGAVADSIGDLDVLVVAGDAGLHAFEDPGSAFERDGDGELRRRDDGALVGDGATWDLATGESDDGRQLARVPARQLFAFAWQDVHGSDAFYGVQHPDP